MLDLVSIRSRLAVRGLAPAAARPPPATTSAREAAVAIVLRERRGHTEVLFIQRAERAGDPWSGHMAFPGGHRDPEDADLPSAAVRETWEEIGLDLSRAPLLGALPDQHPMSGRRNLVVAPFVFAIAGEPALALNQEVAAAVWSPLAPMHRGENAARSRLPSHDDDVALGAGAFHGFRLQDGRFVWGLTYRMVQTFFETIDPRYRRRPD